ncbi:hypothetical protein HPP92_012864 [Vanilla planifolia]|uniref:Uncharacterized protein n=1 Tax=Vanilla planifolia TaxID=51239 RepID=A0A835QRA4_VANPL|nr:hypothetical protein HPP92_012864 [Vanilla planifolia]
MRDANREAETCVQQTAMESTEGVHEGNASSDVNFINNLHSATSTINLTFEQSGQAKLLHTAWNTSLASNPPFQQFAALPALTGQMQQVIHPFPQSGECT